MSVDHIRYDLLVREALRDVVRRLLANVARNGLPGDHHFYISFRTQTAGVRLSPRLLAQYPEEMTIILQHQFWDLVVGEGTFEVGLSFGGVPEKLAVPFEAIKGFFDPSVQFGLEFEPDPPEAAADSKPAARGSVPAIAPKTDIDRPLAAARLEQEAAAGETGPAEQPAASVSSATVKQDGGGEVVRFDRFRKK